jgi:hypothetical protein
MDFPAGCLDFPGHSLDQRAVATDQVPGFFLLAGAAAGRFHAHQARPDVGRRGILKAAVELGFQHWPPDILVGTPPAPCHQPLFNRDAFQPAPVTNDLCGKYGQPQAETVYPTEGWKAQEFQDAVHRVNLTAVVEPHAGLAKTQADLRCPVRGTTGAGGCRWTG